MRSRKISLYFQIIDKARTHQKSLEYSSLDDMYHHFSILILVLLTFYCYSSPIPYIDQNDQEQIHMDEQGNFMKKNDQIDYLNILCAIYKDCYHNDPNDIKPKRLTSNLFHGIPKFGKRAFTSAFSGIPKFG